MMPRHHRQWFVVSFLLTLFAPSTARAHDLWLVPGAEGRTGRPFVLRVNSGTEFPKSEHIPDQANFRSRLLIHPDGARQDLESAGNDGQSGLLRFTPPKNGVYIVAVETQPKLITLDAQKFNAYLVSDGLPQIYALREREGTLDQPGRERYSKSPKALVLLGDGHQGDPCHMVGLPLEIVPMQNPFARKLGDTLRVRVLFRDVPLADANLGWDLPDDGEAASGTVRSDAAGEALVPIARSGLMTIRLTHMTRPKADDYEWESFWTTLTFHLPAAKGAE